MELRQVSPIVSLMGATATGKTAVAIALSKIRPVRVISVDSALIYKGMDIGTAKPTVEEYQQAPHHLIDIINLDEHYNVGDFVKAAKQQIAIARKQQQLPLLVGGSMFYFHALLHGIDDMPEADLEQRQQLEKLAAEKGIDFLHQQLNGVDPESANKIHPNHSQRIIRALEVYQSSGVTLSSWQKQTTRGLLDTESCISFAMNFNDRTLLHQRIEQRFHTMLNAGFEQEVRGLLTQYGNQQRNAFRLVGYRQMVDYINSSNHTNRSYQTMTEKGIVATRQLAKRQMTWLRQWKSPLCWLNIDASTSAEQVAGYMNQIVA